jgi:hypothetical protein
MSGVYKEKNCPNCGILHRKRGNYCGQSCANESRDISEATKKKMSRSQVAYTMTPEGVAAAKRQSMRATAYYKGEELPVTIDEFCVDLPDFPELPDGYDHATDW